MRGLGDLCLESFLPRCILADERVRQFYQSLPETAKEVETAAAQAESAGVALDPELAEEVRSGVGGGRCRVCRWSRLKRAGPEHDLRRAREPRGRLPLGPLRTLSRVRPCPPRAVPRG